MNNRRESFPTERRYSPNVSEAEYLECLHHLPHPSTCKEPGSNQYRLIRRRVLPKIEYLIFESQQRLINGTYQWVFMRIES